MLAEAVRRAGSLGVQIPRIAASRRLWRGIGEFCEKEMWKEWVGTAVRPNFDRKIIHATDCNVKRWNEYTSRKRGGGNGGGQNERLT